MQHRVIDKRNKRSGISNKPWVNALSFMMLLFYLAGCATPVGTRSVGVEKTYEEINITALSGDIYSYACADVLNRFFLADLFKNDPDQAIKILHLKACQDDRRDLLYALAELTYLTAKKTRKGSAISGVARSKSYHLASAIYAYLYLLGERGGPPPSPYDRRFRVACDLYNTALAQALTIRKDGKIFEGGISELPVGNILLKFKGSGFPHDLEKFEAFIPADELSVYGLTVRDRHPGLGVPFIAVEKMDADALVARSAPGTLFLRVEGDIRDLMTGTGSALVEIYSTFERQEVQIGDKTIPLEDDLTAQLAHALNQPFFWRVGRLQFIKGKELVKSGIYTLQPYSPDRIPVVFVHGTVSSPVWWAEMFNTLRSDPVLREKYQFWFYIYDSSKPVVFSAVHLRESLSQKIKEHDPEDRDRALNQMVVVGHSQGGLLAKLTAVNTGDSIIRAVANKGLEDIDLTKDETELVLRYLVFSPLPFVNRVVFISTPHRGSFLVKDWISRLLKKIVSLPLEVLESTATLISTGEKLGMTNVREVGDIRTSVDSMSPKNEGLIALAKIPLAPGVKGHSIIAIKGDDQPPEGDDGVVTYESAHVDYVESEFIVQSGHSCQGHPLVIEEVRRILLKHLTGVGSSD
jgi:pimeloyl-ACP methyl ester carboxylesterase